MLKGFFGRWVGQQGRGEKQPGRPRVALDYPPPSIYAIGDVHGCLDLLLQMEEMIVADAQGFAGEKLLVMLGDYVDRGPRSAQCLDHLLSRPPAGFQRLCLLGNHEATMLGFLADPVAFPEWLVYGGRDTLASYGIDPDGFERLGGNWRRQKQMLDSHVPDEHRAFLENLPIMLETPGHVFVHAGLRPGMPIAAQEDSDLVWFRDDYASSFSEWGKTVIHGHTPRLAPLVSPNRIAIDTGAFMTGKLSAVRLRLGEPPFLLSTGRT